MASASQSLRSLHHTTFPIYPYRSFNSRCCPRFSVFSFRSPAKIRASSVLALEPDSSTLQENTLEFELFACPVCYEPLIRKGPPGLNLPAIYRSGFKCSKCNKSYSSKDIYLDLTITAGTKAYTEFKPTRTELFRAPKITRVAVSTFFTGLKIVCLLHRAEVELCWIIPADLSASLNAAHPSVFSEFYYSIRLSLSSFCRSPLVSFLYERGWRQNFSRSGFPGLDEEFKMAQEFFKPAEGGLLVDVSCGSGLFSRKFAKSGIYSGVIALDFSENMLRQCHDFIKKDDTILTANLALVRADVSRLPFSSGSVDAVHAGAALHCWPSPSNAVAEISRILRSGGVFVGTTFLASVFDDSFASGISRRFRRLANTTYSNLSKEEIEDLIKSCGLVNYTSKIQQSFIMFSAQKS